MIKNSSTIKDKRVAFLEQATVIKLKHASWLKRNTMQSYRRAEFGMQCSLDWLSEFSQVKAFAKYAVINMQYAYTGANTNSYFLLQNKPSESLWKQWLCMFENKVIKIGQYTILLWIWMST